MTKLKEAIEDLKSLEKRYTVHLADKDAKKLRKVIASLESMLEA